MKERKAIILIVHNGILYKINFLQLTPEFTIPLTLPWLKLSPLALVCHTVITLYSPVWRA